MEFLETIKPFTLIAYYIFVSFVVLLIILDNKKPEKAFAFIFLILLVPVGGIVIYLLFGAQYQKKKLFTKKRYFDKVYLNKLSEGQKGGADIRIDSTYSKLPTLFYNIEQVNFTLNNEITLLNNGEEKFPALIRELKRAKESIHLDYYIIRESEIAREVIDILCQKSSEGLKVRVIYDDVGSSLSRSTLSRMRQSGVASYPYMPVVFSRLAHKANYRNHRKIAVIDNEIGFVGGININDKYINPSKTGLYWRDTHIMIKGEAVIDLQYLFISDWYFVSGQKIDLEEVHYRNLSNIQSTVPTSILGSDYGKNNQTIKEAFFRMITSAQEEVLITTPYFVPDESILNALKITAKSGVKVSLILPEKPDSKTAFFASQTYFKDLLNSGVEINYYTRGLMHSKIMIIDGTISTVGSTNMDQRSFNLNAEVNAFMLSKSIAQDLKSNFMIDLKDSYPLTLDILRRRKWYVKVVCSIARLLAPIL
ncbi:MAG: cardiolipin synthase [Lutimonas sp.]